MKKLNYWSTEECTKIIQKYKDDTAYFSKDVTMEEMWEIFRHNYKFGKQKQQLF